MPLSLSYHAYIRIFIVVSWQLMEMAPLNFTLTLSQHITKHSSALYIGMAKVLPIIDVLGYDGQNSSFSSSFRFNTHNSKKKPYINMKLCDYVGFRNGKRLVVLTCL